MVSDKPQTSQIKNFVIAFFGMYFQRHEDFVSKFDDLA